MAAKFDDRAWETATAAAPAGTGNFTMLGAVQSGGAISFVTFLTATGDWTTYEADNGTAWETGILTRQSDGSYARTVKRSTNSNNAVSFSSGTTNVKCTAPAWLFDHLNMIEETVTSAATFNIGAIQALRILASGTTGPITSFGTTPNKLRIVRWAGSILTHNATTLILLGGVSRTTATGDIGIYASDGSGNWRELSYQKADGTPQFTGIEVGHATDTTVTRASAGDIAVEGNRIFRVGGADVPVADGGTGASTAAAAATNLGLGTGDSPAFTALTLSGGQLSFPATQNPSAGANVLDDYEEGTWTPIDSSGASLTFTGVDARYTKIGRQVHASATVTYPSTANGSAARIGGFPFTCANVEGARTGNISYHNGATAALFILNKNATTGDFVTNNGTSATNAQMSTFLTYFSADYSV